MTQHRNPRDIEAGIERDRASLASTMDALQDRVSVDNLAREALGTLRTNAAAYTKSVDQAVRSNPVAIGLVGVGLAWLIFGGKKSGADSDSDPFNTSRHLSDDPFETDDNWSREADSLRQRASGSLKRIEDDAQSYYADLRDGLADRYADARDYASEKAAVLAEFADGLRQSFSGGLERVSEDARERIVAARERAYAARLRAERLAKKSSHEIVRAVEDHPLVAGAVALALGAALAGALPRTRTEDDAFGKQSDRLMKDAKRLLESEKERAMRVAEGVGEELVDGMKETVDAASERASEIGERAKERAIAEAKDTPRSTAQVAGKSNG